MKQLKYILLISLAAGLSACEEDTVPEVMAPSLTLEAPSDRGRSFITLNGYISDFSQVKEAGFVLWETGTEGNETEYPLDDFSENRVQNTIKKNEYQWAYLHSPNRR